VTLLAPEKALLATKPTQNLDAYDLYLRGREKYEGATSLMDIDGAVAMIEQAVALDSTFARAQAFLARTYANQYFNNIHTEQPRLKQALHAAQAAMRHSTNQPSGHIAMGYYYYYASRDYKRALEEFAIAEKMLPNNAEVLEAMGYVQRRQGKWDEGVKNIERAVELDPKTEDRYGNLVQALVYMRRYDEARRYIKRGLEVAPNSISFRTFEALVLLAETGDGKTTKQMLEVITPKYGPIAAFEANCDIFNRDYDAVARDLPSLRAFPGIDTVQFYTTRATAYYFDGQLDKMRTYADSALVVLDAKDASHSKNATVLAEYGSILAILGRHTEGLRYVNQAIELLPVEKDALAGADLRSTRMIMYLVTGDFEAALDEIQYLLSIPSSLTPAVLRMHPGFDMLRDNPRFKKLAEEKVSS